MPDPDVPVNPRENARLAAAIGQVAMASAEADSTVERLINESLMFDDYGWVLYVGQGSDWLIQSMLKIIEVGGGPHKYRARPGDYAELVSLLKRLDELRKFRNAVIHGTWGSLPRYSEIDDEDPKWRPLPRFFGNFNSDPVIYCHLPKRRDIGPDRAVAISDVERLASELDQCRARIYLLLKVMGDRPSSI